MLPAKKKLLRRHIGLAHGMKQAMANKVSTKPGILIGWVFKPRNTDMSQCLSQLACGDVQQRTHDAQTPLLSLPTDTSTASGASPLQ